MAANDQQVGGAHYQKGKVQHWDVVTIYGICYLMGNASKYLLRWRDKNGVQDLQKCQHYVDKAVEMWKAGHGLNMVVITPVPEAVVQELTTNHRMTEQEGKILRIMLRPLSIESLLTCKYMVASLLRHTEKFHPGTPEDGGHHSKQEET